MNAVFFHPVIHAYDNVRVLGLRCRGWNLKLHCPRGSSSDGGMWFLPTLLVLKVLSPAKDPSFVTSEQIEDINFYVFSCFYWKKGCMGEFQPGRVILLIHPLFFYSDLSYFIYLF